MTVTAIALGMVLMILSAATGTGLQKAIKNKIIGFGGHIQIQNYDVNRSFERVPIRLDKDLKTTLETWSPAVHYQATATKAGIASGSDDFDGIVLKGVDGNYDPTFFQNNLVAGKIPKFNSEWRSDSVLISETTAKNLKLNVGDEMAVYFIREAPKAPQIRYFTISGLYNTGMPDFDKLYVLCDLEHIRKLNKWDNEQCTSIEVFIADLSKLDEQTEELRALLPFNIDAKSIRSENAQLFQWLDLFDINVYLIITIMLIVATINMISSLLIIILERTTSIGLLKSLGANNWMIRKIFLHQAVFLILRGVIIGNILGLGICYIQWKFEIFALDPSTYYVSTVPISVEWWWILALNALTIITCTIANVFPSYLVTKIRPAKALRFN